MLVSIAGFIYSVNSDIRITSCGIQYSHFAAVNQNHNNQLVLIGDSEKLLSL